MQIACFLGDLLWKHYHRGRQRALDNLRAIFPEKSEEWIQQTGRRSFEQLVMLTVDVLVTPRVVQKQNRRQYAHFEKAEHPKWLIKEGKGTIMVTAHYGNFELIGYMAGLFNFDIVGIARPLDNRYLNRFLYRVRQRHGLKLIDKKGAAEMMPEIHQARQHDRFHCRSGRRPQGHLCRFFSAARPAPTKASACWQSRTTCRSS